MMYRSVFYVIFWLIGFGLLTGCSNNTVMPPNGGASLKINQPLWISGTYVDGISFTKDLPRTVENEYLKVVNAGFWLLNSNNKVSQLGYAFDLTVKKPFSQEKVYTRAILEDPSKPNTPIIYEHYLTLKEKSTKVKHLPLYNITKNTTYHLIFEIYSDSERTKLVSKIEQSIISIVDNSSGCVQLPEEYMQHVFGRINDQYGKEIPTNKLMIECRK